MFKRISLLLFFLLNLGIILYFFFLESSTATLYIALGRITGLLGVYLVLWEILFVSRLEFINKCFKSNARLAWFHHVNGFLALLFIFLHPVFLALGYGQRTGRSLLGQMIAFFSWDDMPLAYLSLLVFIVAVFLSYRQIKKKYKYELWYVIHLSLYLAIFWAFGHQLEIGHDLQNTLFAVYWYALYFIFFGALVLGRALPPLYNFYRHRFKVEDVVSENDFCCSIYISGRNLESFKFKAGQHASFRFLNNSAWQSHPFSFSSAYNGKYLRITVKALGDFTKNLKDKIKIGDYVMVAGAYGDFYLPENKETKLAFVAGGVGITPFIAMSQEAKEKEMNFKLLWSNQRRADIILGNEFEACNIISQEEGRIDAAKIQLLVPDYLDRHFYICGPKPMMDSVIEILLSLGVKKSAIHFEKFSF